MTAMSCERDICHHQCTWFELGEDIFFTDTDCYPSWLCEITDSPRKERAIFDGVENTKYLFSEGFAVFFEKMWQTSNTIYPCFWRGTKSEIVCRIREVRDEIVESIIVKLEGTFFWNERCTEVSLRSYFNQIIHIHTDTSSCWEATSRIVWLIDEPHFFELFHVISDCCGRDIHTFITNEGFTSCRIATLYILSDDESENLDFSSIDGGLSAVHIFVIYSICHSRQISPQGYHGNFPMRSNEARGMPSLLEVLYSILLGIKRLLKKKIIIRKKNRWDAPLGRMSLL